MRRLAGVLMFGLVTACQPIAMPSVPAVQTDAGRQCVQRRYARMLWIVEPMTPAAYSPA
jgi:hypothetical protein